MDEGGLICVRLVVMFVFGGITAAIAASKGRSVVGWFFAGFFITLIGLIIILCMSNLKHEQAYRQSAEIERHRLREQLRQEQMKHESFRRYSMERLDAHDQALEMDTRNANALPGSQQPQPYQLANDPAGAMDQLAQQSQAQPMNPQQVYASQWFYEMLGQRKGPVSEATLLTLIRSKVVKANTLLWAEGFVDWTPAYRVPQFSAAVNS